jgi:hypothetical protein
MSPQREPRGIDASTPFESRADHMRTRVVVEAAMAAMLSP